MKKRINKWIIKHPIKAFKNRKLLIESVKITKKVKDLIK